MLRFGKLEPRSGEAGVVGPLAELRGSLVRRVAAGDFWFADGCPLADLMVRGRKLAVFPTAMASRLQFLRRLPRLLKPSSSSSSSSTIRRFSFLLLEASRSETTRWSPACRTFCSRPLNLGDDPQGPAAIDYSSVLQEDEFHRLSNSTIHHLLEKLEEYGDNVEIDGFDVDYGNEVLTLKLGDLGTYVLNKQTPNRQIWLSSPVSGPARFDWDRNAQTWVYRRSEADLLNMLEGELERLCGEPISLS